MQLSSQFGARGTSADDRHMKLAGTYRALLRLGANAGIHQAAIKARRLGRGLQRHRMLGNARCAEIVGDAADRDHQRVVGDGPWRRDLAALVIKGGAETHFPGGTIEPDHFAQTVTEPVPMRLGEVVQLVLAGVHAARRHSVQQRLPKMRPGTLHQRDARPLAPAEAVAEPGDQLEPRGAAADHDNLVQALVLEGPARAGYHHLAVQIGNRCVVLGLAVQHLRHRVHSEWRVGRISEAHSAVATDRMAECARRQAPHFFRPTKLRTSAIVVTPHRPGGKRERGLAR